MAGEAQERSEAQGNLDRCDGIEINGSAWDVEHDWSWYTLQGVWRIRRVMDHKSPGKVVSVKGEYFDRWLIAGEGSGKVKAGGEAKERRWERGAEKWLGMPSCVRLVPAPRNVWSYVASSFRLWSIECILVFHSSHSCIVRRKGKEAERGGEKKRERTWREKEKGEEEGGGKEAKRGGREKA